MLFVTNNMTTEEAEALVALALPLMDDSGRIPWAKVEDATGIGYSRGWLIVRRAYLELNQPGLIVDTNGLIAEARAHFTENGRESEFNPVKDGLGRIAEHYRDNLSLSWGEIAVRFGIPESRVRAAYKSLGGKKDRGLRIGKGGRFVYDEPVLYEDNRKVEGAHIPADLARKPKPEECLNFDKEGRTIKERARLQAEKAAKAAARSAAAKKAPAKKAVAAKAS
jgi:hypothetical protein